MAKFKAKQPTKADPMVKVTLVCNYLKGRYPKLTAPRAPNGLKFRNGLCDITHADLIHLEKNPDFEILMQKNEIRILRAGMALPKSSTPRVVTSRPVSTEDHGGHPAGAPTGNIEVPSESEVEKFEKAE